MPMEAERLQAAAAAPKGVAFEIRHLNASFATFGAVIGFQAGMEPFARYDLGNFARALEFQLSKGTNVAAIAGNRLVGYCGWLPTTHEIAAAWVDGAGQLTSAGADADAVAVTVVACREPSALAPLIRRIRQANPGRRFYFKRQYADLGRRPRKTSVADIGPA